ncbi:hypothetical protein KHA80_09575 [Anaerobacillus sp. HL2]|nr:hypothetical protein KHA80_09575 [Anaerobacillus sp. HL2]
MLVVLHVLFKLRTRVSSILLMVISEADRSKKKMGTPFTIIRIHISRS